MNSRLNIKVAVLATAILLIAGVVAIMACAPAAPTGGGSGDTPSATQPPSQEQPEATATMTPTPSPTPEIICSDYFGPRGEAMTTCQPAVPPIIRPDLQDDIDRHMAEKEKAAKDGRSTETKIIQVMILTETPDTVDALVAFLEANTSGRIRSGKTTDGTYSSGASAYLSIEIVPEIAELDGISEIYETETFQPEGSNRQGTPPATLTEQQLMKVRAWYAANITGSVQAAIIDHDFRLFRNTVLLNTNRPVRWLCYDALGMATQSISTDPNTDFSPCERPHQPPLANPHGTTVAAALIEIAPDAELFISNANRPDQV